MTEPRILNGIAIVGLDLRVPGGSDAQAFWRNLRNGVESIVFLSDDELERRGIPEALRRTRRFVAACAVPDGFDEFDAAFFGFSPREAEAMDPQLRMFLESAWAALEDAGYETSRYRGSIGVAAGVGGSDYFLHNVQPNRAKLKALDGLQIKLSNASDSLATMTSYKLDLTGPSYTVQTACSSSLVAVHLACQSLLNGECDLMLAGGVTLGAASGYLHVEGGILSRDGHCRPFDAEASGTVPGSGVGVVVLKRLEQALEDRDTIRAVILGSAVGNDGSGKAGYTAPSVLGHARVVTEALAVAGVTADSIGYLETHGTGTEVGDPIEIEGLTAAFRETTRRTGFCAIGSVKSNIGHLDHAAGVVSLIKAVLALENREIPGSPTFRKPNPRIDFESSPFHVARELTPWPEPTEGTPRRAGVSSLGIGGTNAHVILEEAPPVQEGPKKDGPVLLLLSARSERALDEMSKRLAAHLRSHPELALEDVAYTLDVGRRRFPVRRAIVAASASEAASLLLGTSSSETAEEPEAFLRGLRPRRVPLPTYPFERQRYWLDPPKERPSASTAPSAVEKTGSPRDWLYLPAYRAASAPRPLLEPSAKVHRFLFFADESPMSRLVASRLKDLGHELIEVKPGETFRKLASDRYAIRPAAGEDYRGLLEELRASDLSVDRVAHFWSFGPHGESRALAFESLLYASRALGESGGEGGIRLFFVSSGLESFGAGEALSPTKRMALGLLPVVRQELPSLTASAIDLRPPGDDFEGAEDLVERTVSELLRETDEPLVALRDGWRYVATFEKLIAVPGAGSTPPREGLKEGGVYLITGGLGQLGLAIAEHLARRVRAKLVLVSRTALPERKDWEDALTRGGAAARRIQAILRIESAGGEILAVAADAADRDAMTKAFEAAESRFGAVDGVIHAAGILDGRTLAPLGSATFEEMERQFRPKVAALPVLEELVRDRSLDFVLLMSSLSAVLGGVGYGIYAAANAFMDGFALEMRRRGSKVPWITVAWDAWSAYDEATRGSGYGSEISRLALTRSEGLEALDLVLSLRSAPRIVVSTADLSARIERWSIREGAAAAAAARAEEGASRHPRPALGSVFVAPETPTEARLAEIWGDLLGVDRVGIRDNFFELGGSSLLAIQLASRVERELGVKMPTTAIFEGPTIQSFGRLVLSRTGTADRTAEAVKGEKG